MNTAGKCPCPPSAELEKLLDGSLSADRQQECVAHMDSCQGCQTKLEEIATAGTNLSRVVEHLDAADPVATSAYWPAIKAVEGELRDAIEVVGRAEKKTARAGTGGGVAQKGDTPAPFPAPGARHRDIPLDFLEPAVDSAYLGRLAHFDVMRILGRGGMGIVLEAFDSRLQRNVAIKILDPELAGDEVARQRFCREARAAASITHENVVAVHQVEKSTDGTVAYLVMQLVAGESLEQRLARQKQLPLREIVRIGMQAAHGLAAAHAQGLIHRDIKPGNILLEPPHDRVKLTDFGLARVEEDVKLTRTGFVSGTPLYMAPEQALGEEPDPRSDLFSLGAILYEMCAGRPPFTGNSALAILRQITETKHQPIRELNPAVPEWLARTIDRLLTKKPADRVASAAELAELFDFEWALMKTTSDDVPTVCEVEARKQTVRNRRIAGGLAALALVLGLIGGRFFLGTGRPVSSAEPVAVLSANAGTVWSVGFDPSTDAVAMAVEDGTVRLWDRPTSAIKATFAAHRGTVWSTLFSPDGRLLATAGDDGLIKLWSAAGGDPQGTFRHATAVRGLAFTPDGRKLYAGDRGGTLRVWSLTADQTGPAPANDAAGAAKSFTDNSPQPLFEAQQPGTVYAVALSSDARTLASVGSDKIVRLWNAETLTPKLPLEGHTGPVYALSFHPDGRRLASAGWDKTVRIWDTTTGQLLKSWEEPGGDLWSVAYSPDGSRLATGGHDGAVKIWSAETGELQATDLGHQLAVHALAFHPNGKWLASGGRDGAVRIWKMD